MLPLSLSAPARIWEEQGASKGQGIFLMIKREFFNDKKDIFNDKKDI